MSTNLELVETACAELADGGAAISFTAIAAHTGISRTTLYRNPQLRAVIEDHRRNSHDRHTLTGLAAEMIHLRTALGAVADRVRQHEERLRRLEAQQLHRRAN